jgi:hypothetical protein
LQALYPYRHQKSVATACAEAFECLSNMQHNNGIFSSGGSECSESCAWVIVACTTWGINPDTDPRFIKNGKSVVDGLLSHYLESEAQFQHIIGAGANGMATDQACYALVAYNRFINGKTSLFDYSDVTFEGSKPVNTGTPKATLGLPTAITDDIGRTFNATVNLDRWDNTAEYKLIDFVINVPKGLSITNVTSDNRLTGGTVNYYLEADTGKLRVVYFDANNNSDLTVSGNTFPLSAFTVTLRVDSVNAGDKLEISLGGISLKRTSVATDEDSMTIVDSSTANGSISVVAGISFSAVCLYTGDGIDLIPSSKKAVAVSLPGIEKPINLVYNDGTNKYEFKYSTDISKKSGVATYIALVDASIDMNEFVNKSNFTFEEKNAAEITFGDTNGDGVINAQDALTAVDTWLRKCDIPSDSDILAINVNCDSRINTFDALGIVEAFVNGSDFSIVTKAATLTTKN